MIHHKHHAEGSYEWMPLGDYMRELEADLVYQGFMRILNAVKSTPAVSPRQRRIVYVTRRKHLARKRRKR